MVMVVVVEAGGRVAEVWRRCGGVRGVIVVVVELWWWW